MLKKNNNNILKNIYFLEFLDLNSKNTKNAHLFINKNKLDLKNELMYNFTDFDFTYYFSQKTQKFLIKFYSQSQPEVNNNHLNEINMHTEIFNYKPVLVVNNYFIDNFIFVTYLTQLNSNRWTFSINSFSLNILLKKKKIKKKKKKNLYVYKINRFSLLINNFIHKNTKNVKKIKKIKYKVFIKKIKSKVLFNFKTNKILYKTIIKKDKIFKKIKFLKKNFSKTKSLNNLKIDNYSFFKKIKKYNNNNNSILYSLIDNFKHNINYNYNNIKKFSIFDYLFLNSKNLEKYYLNFYLLSLPNENKKISNLSIKNHFIDLYINNKLDSNNNSVNTDNKYSEGYIKSVFNDIKIDPKDVYNNTEYNLFKKENICFFFNFKGGRLTTFRGARKVHWNFFKGKKKINSRKYTNFIHIFLKKNNKYLFNVLNFFIFKFNLSFNFLIDFMSTYMHFFKKTINYNEIYQLPIDLEFWTILKKKNLEKLKIDLKINSWLLKTIKINSTFWMERKKTTPIFLKKKSFLNNTFNKNIQYDFLTNYFIIFKTNNYIITDQELIFKNKFLKLNNYKYKS